MESYVTARADTEKRRPPPCQSFMHSASTTVSDGPSDPRGAQYGDAVLQFGYARLRLGQDVCVVLTMCVSICFGYFFFFFNVLV